jgi:class 3 adenylate cyclase
MRTDFAANGERSCSVSAAAHAPGSGAGKLRAPVRELGAHGRVALLDAAHAPRAVARVARPCAIFEHDGPLVGYRGDGLPAVFGAPIELDDHADRALAAAREMLEVRLARFNAGCASRA